MKRIIIAAIMFFQLVLTAQSEEGSYKLTSDKIDEQGKILDSQIIEIYTKIKEVIVRADLLNIKDIRVLPYQSSYKLGKDYIEIERYNFTKNAGREEITVLKTKKIKIYTDGKTILKVESEILEKDFVTEQTITVKYLDPTPLDTNTDDITFTHMINSKVLMDNKKLGDIKNTTAYPVRNEIKREFLVNYLQSYYNLLIFITEAYGKSSRDTDTTLFEFLKQSTRY